ncbi:MAG: SH3 domain-containing protein [Hyphomicrobiaceae bacterium]
MRLAQFAIVGVTLGCLAAGASADEPAGSSGLPVPRFVSLKSDRVNVRKGPGTDYPIAWVFQKAGLPVEVVREYGAWRQVRDSDGTEGWIIQNLLSGRRTAVVTPWKRTQKSASQTAARPTALHADASTDSAVIAYAEAGTLAGLIACDKTWCEISVADRRGYVEQSQLWGVYKDEEID